MRITLLGTGAADGWPNPWCSCGSCRDQRSRQPRTPTSALLDGRVLLEAGPETPRQLVRAGVDGGRVETVLITHAHDDHCHPSFLMHRSWVTDRPLVVIGPAPVITACRSWLPEDQRQVRFISVGAGDSLEVSGYRLTAVPANHEAFGEALLWAVDDGRHALLWATDTGPWARGTREALAGWRFDAVLLEETFGLLPPKSEGHHNLTTFAAALDDLTRWGNIDEHTRRIAIHLGHDNPPLPELQAHLAALGAEVHPDLSVLDIG